MAQQKYTDGSGVAEIWANIKNYVTAQLLGFVDLISPQTISGAKTFTSTPTVKKDSAGDLLYLIDNTINTSNEDENGLPLTGHTNALKIRGHGTNMIPCMLTANVFTSGDTSAELRTYKYKDISSNYSSARMIIRYKFADNTGYVTFSNISSIIPSKTNTTNLGSPSLQWNNTYTRNILIDNDINIASSMINKTSTSGNLAIRSGPYYSDGASINLKGKDQTDASGGRAYITANDGTNRTELVIYPTGETKLTINSTIKNLALQEDLSTVATSGNYNDLTNKPTIPNVSNYYTKAEVDALISNAGVSPSANTVFIGEPYSLVNSAETNLGNYEEVSND